MSEQDNLRIIQKMYSDFSTGNIPAVLDSMADDVVWKQSNDGPEPFAGTVQGREQLGEWFEQMDAVSEVEAFEVHEYFSEGDKVIVLGHYKYRSKATGKEWESDWAMVWTIKHGKITQGQILEDTLAQATAMQSE